MSTTLRVLTVPDGWHSHFALFSGPPAETEVGGLRIVSEGVPCESRSLPGMVRFCRDLRLAAARFQPDVVHVHFGSVRAVLAVLISPVPVVISFKGSDLLGNYNSRGRRTVSGRISILLSRLSAFGASFTIAKTEELRSRLWSRRCRDRCHVIPNGVNLERFRPIARDEARKRLGWDPTRPVVLFMDRAGAWVKDPRLAAAAFRAAQRELPSLRLQVVKSEPPERMPLFYSASDALLLTSRHEGSNNTVKEALACSLPVVATACGDTGERLAGVTHCHVCQRDPEELGARLVDVIRAGERCDGRARMLPLSEDWMLRETVAVYERVLEASPTRTAPYTPAVRVRAGGGVARDVHEHMGA